MLYGATARLRGGVSQAQGTPGLRPGEQQKGTRRLEQRSRRPWPVRSPVPAFGIFQLFLALSPCSLASCHFSGSCCQNC